MGNLDTFRWKLFLKPIEKFWCKQTDYIVIPIENGKAGYYEEFRDKIAVIPQGIDFSGVILDKYVKNKYLKGFLSDFDPEIVGIKVLHGQNQAGDIPHSLACIDKAVNLLQYALCYSMQEGLCEAVKWY